MIKLIWAMDKNNLIGTKKGLPWNIKEELIHFKNTTLNNNILFGRKTFELINKKFINRKVLILTKNKNYKINDNSIIIENNFIKIIKKYKNNFFNNIFICGGLEIYKIFFSFADELIVSIIEGEYNGNVYFPNFSFDNFKLNKIEDKKKFIIKYYLKK